MKRINFNEKEIKNIIGLYKKNKLSAEKIGKIYSCSRSTILRLLDSNKVERNEQSDFAKIQSINSANRKNNFNFGFFKEIDNEYKAYILGIMASDGNIAKDSNNISIQLSNDEKDNSEKNLIEHICEIINFDKKNIKKIKRSGNRKDAYKIIFTSYETKQDLISLGVIPNKTDNLDLKKVLSSIKDKSLIRHFIRGYFDGDGCFSISINKKYGYLTPTFNITLLTNNAKTMIDAIDLNINFGISEDNRTDGKMCQIKTGKQMNILLLYRYLYSNSNIALKRKKEKFEYYLKHKNLL